jgi:dolichol kinase
VGGLIGTWTKWCLKGRNPWTWALWWVVEGRTWWARLGLLGYWWLLGTLSVAGWNRQLARLRRIRPAAPESPSDSHLHPNPTVVGGDRNGSAAMMGGTGTGAGLTELLDAADRRVPTLSVNARRKFFHGLAVVMFVPGIALDVSLFASVRLGFF